MTPRRATGAAMEADDLLALSDEDFIFRWGPGSGMSPDDKQALPDHIRRKCIERYCNLIPLRRSGDRDFRQRERHEHTQSLPTVALNDFYAYLPAQKYIYTPTGALWTAGGVNGNVQWPNVSGKPMKPTAYLDQFRGVQQLTWAPGEPQLITDSLIADGGWIEHDGARVFNQYRAPTVSAGDPAGAGFWRAYLRRIYPNHAEHIELWCAQRIQHPGEKPNHALLLIGPQGIGKDTLLEPIKTGIGSWNWQEISPKQMLGQFNGWGKAVVVRVSEACDLGNVDRFGFYEHSKTLIAGPPDVIRINEKYVGEYYIPNVCGIVITSNHETGGIFLPGDDRRHYVASSDAHKEDFDSDYFNRIYNRYAAGGLWDVVAFLRSVDLSNFDPKAPPPKTDAWLRIVHANTATETAEIAELLEAMGNPVIVTLEALTDAASARKRFELVDFLRGIKTRRQVQHRLEEAGYNAVPNRERRDRRWLINGRRQMVYAINGSRYDDVKVRVRAQ
jgi:hypothetical protein